MPDACKHTNWQLPYNKEGLQIDHTHIHINVFEWIFGKANSLTVCQEGLKKWDDIFHIKIKLRQLVLIHM